MDLLFCDVAVYEKLLVAMQVGLVASEVGLRLLHRRLSGLQQVDALRDGEGSGKDVVRR